MCGYIHFMACGCKIIAIILSVLHVYSMFKVNVSFWKCTLKHCFDFNKVKSSWVFKCTIILCYRGVIYHHDVVQYDNLVNKYEIEAYQKLSMKLHLPLNHRLNKKPRKNLITTEIGKEFLFFYPRKFKLCVRILLPSIKSIVFYCSIPNSYLNALNIVNQVLSAMFQFLIFTSTTEIKKFA